MVYYEITSKNAEKNINSLYCVCELNCVKITEKCSSFKVSLLDSGKINKFLKQHKIEVVSKKTNGLASLFNRFTSVGLIIAILISLILYAVSNAFVFKVQLSGNVNFKQDEIIDTLKDINVTFPVQKNQLDVKRIESKLIENKYVSAVSIIVKGTTLVINIKEKLNNSEYTNIGNFEPIISKYDAVVTSINVIQGTSKICVGDIVQIGDILVEPYIMKNDGTCLNVQPLAEIYCDVWITTNLNVPNKKIVQSRTGRTNIQRTMTLCGIVLDKSESICDFDKYEKEINNYYISSFLPIQIQEEIFYETAISVVEIDFEQQKEYFIEQCRQMSLLNFSEYDIIKDESYMCENKEDKNTIIYTVTVGRRVS